MPRIGNLALIALSLLVLRPSLALSGQARNLSDPAYKKAVLEEVAGLVDKKYVLADKAGAFAVEFRAKAASGAYDACVEPKDFAARVTADLIAITHDKHLNFRVVEASDVKEQALSPLHHPVRYFRLKQKENVGFTRLEFIEPRIGYLELRRFNSFEEAKPMVLAAMKFLANARAIIIDVRENGGGSGDYLSSYFLPYPTQLTGSFSRERGTIDEFWTRGDTGLEPRLDVPVFILIGPRAFSAAESFAYDMQSRKRAILIGEPTKGGAHSVDVFPVGDAFEFYISTGRGVSPVTGGNWEGVGVLPDIAVPSEKALAAAVAEAATAGEAYGRAEDARIKKAVAEMEALSERGLKAYREGRTKAGLADLEAMFKIAATEKMLSEFFVMVFAYNFQSPRDETLLLDLLRKKAELFPDSTEALTDLASVCRSRGMKDEARAAVRGILALDPKNPNAARMLKELEK